MWLSPGKIGDVNVLGIAAGTNTIGKVNDADLTWKAGTLGNYRVTASGTLVTPTNDFYVVSFLYENRSGAANSANIKDGGAGGTVKESVSCLDDVTFQANYGDAPLKFSTDVYASKAVGGGGLSISGYDA